MSSTVHLAVTITSIALCGGAFIFILLQLLLLLYYRHPRLSYQTLILFTALLWAALRTTLFSFYFEDRWLSDHFSTFPRWLLFALPVYLQYNVLNILLFYFLEVVGKMTYPSNLKMYKCRVFTCVFICNVLFLCCSLLPTLLRTRHPGAPSAAYVGLVCYLLFLMGALVLCFCVLKLTRMSSSQMSLEGRGVSVCQAVCVCVFIAIVYSTRSIYYILTLLPIPLPVFFNYTGFDVSEKGDISHTNAFILFGVVVIVWELLPTVVCLCFFRVKHTDGRSSTSSLKTDSFHNKQYFFDNPNRYDSDDEWSLPRTPARNLTPGRGGLFDVPRFSQAGLVVAKSGGGESPGNYGSRGKVMRPTSYGSVPPFGTATTPTRTTTTTTTTTRDEVGSFSPHIRGTTPPLLFPKGASVGSIYHTPYKSQRDDDE